MTDKGTADELKKLLAVDAVPVVRCGECERRNKSADLTDTVYCRWLKLQMKKNRLLLPRRKEIRKNMTQKTLITCGQATCDYNFDGYCKRKNIHVSSKDKTCDAYNERTKTTDNKTK